MLCLFIRRNRATRNFETMIMGANDAYTHYTQGGGIDGCLVDMHKNINVLICRGELFLEKMKDRNKRGFVPIVTHSIYYEWLTEHLRATP